ncbi:MAG: YscO family type III secretion system apparatus protein [Pseudomonadota bacterium]
MISQFKTLCHVKKLREQNKLKTLRAKRAAVAAALDKEEAQRRTVTENRAALPAKKAAIYDEIMLQKVSVPDIDLTKEKISKLEQALQALEDEAERLTQIRIRYEAECDTARNEYQIAQRHHEKLTMVTSDLESVQTRVAEAKEDAEIEDLFSKKQEIRK